MKPRKKKSISERFYSKIEKTNTCWNWTGAKVGGMGYGIIGRGPRGTGTVLAHRLSWELHYGEIPKNLQVCHKCDNPLCVNPDHLFLGSQYDNMQDMLSKKRENNKGRKKLSQYDVDKIRKEYSAGGISLSKLGEIFGIKKKQVHRIVTFQNWK